MAKQRQPAQQVQTEAPAQEQVQETPRYRLTDKGYFPVVGVREVTEPGEDEVFTEKYEILLDPEEMPLTPTTKQRMPLVIEYTGEPGPHMVPLNDAARAMVKKYPPRDMMQAINDLHVVGKP